jgi:hypothetical protein
MRLLLITLSERDYVVDLDKVWQWIGFSRKDPAKRLLDSYFTEGTDYKVLSHTSVENPQGGRPNEKIMMNIKTH